MIGFGADAFSQTREPSIVTDECALAMIHTMPQTRLNRVSVPG